MRKKFGIPARAGIIMTTVWLAWRIGWRGHQEVQAWRDAGWRNFSMCSDGEIPELFAGQDCSIYPRFDQGDEQKIWLNAIGFGVQWAVVGWIAFGLTYWALRWVLAGRDRVDAA